MRCINSLGRVDFISAIHQRAGMHCLAVFAFLMPGLIAAAEPPPKIPLRDFFKNPLSSSYLLSPNGNTLSYLAPWETRMNIFVRPTAGGEAKRITSDKERDIREYFWKGNQFVVYAQDKKGDENFHLLRIDLKSGEVKDLTPFPKVRAELVDDLEDISANEIVMMMNKRNAEVFDAYRLNVATGAMKMIAKNPGHVDHWVTDHKGRILAATESDGVNATLLTRPDEKAPFKKVLSTNFRERLTPEFYTFDNKEIYATSNIGRDKVAIVKIDPATAKETETIYENPEVDVDSLAFSKKRKVLTYAEYTTWREERKYLDPQTEKMYSTIEQKLPGYQIDLVGNNHEEDKFVVAATSDRTPGSRYLFDAKTKELTKLVDVAPWLKEDQLAPMKPIEYKSRDGLIIHGYLTLPLERVAIYGGSYGGYATLAGVTYTPDLFAAAVDYVGISNLFTFMKTIPPYWKPFLDQMYEMVGDPEKDKDLFTAMSPALNADKIKTPLFVAQGAQDPRVNKAESDQIVESLRKRGVDVEYMVKENEGHGFNNEENRFAFYEATEAFLAKHLKQKS